MRYALLPILALSGCTWFAPPKPMPPQQTPPAAAATPAAGDAAAATPHRAAIEKGLAWLGSHQNPNGSWGKIPGFPEDGYVGITALALRACAAGAGDKTHSQFPWQKAVDYLLSKQQPDGSIYEPKLGNSVYNTSVAISGLVAYLHSPGRLNRHQPQAIQAAVDKARAWLASAQFAEAGGVGQGSPHYGGWGYGKEGQPDADLSNVQFAIQALHDAGLPKDDPAWQHAVVFLQRCQNRSESNDLTTIAVGNDGGFIYDPGIARDKSVPATRPDGRIEIPSYASMTYAGLLSMVYADLGRDDPRVRAALDWIRGHYTLEENSGLGTSGDARAGKQGLFYYYQTFARALAAWGEDTVATTDGTAHDWARELADRVVAIQRPDGSWLNEENDRWWEGDPVLVTTYSLIALEIAAGRLEGRRP